MTDADVQAALDELLSHTSTLTRALLGVRADGETDGPAPAPDSAHGWMRAFPGPERF